MYPAQPDHFPDLLIMSYFSKTVLRLKFICFDCVIYSGDVCMKGEGLVNVGIVVGAVILRF